MKNTPEISVILPVFNGEKTIQTAIDSILSQTFTNFELIIINDGSFDGTKELLSKVKDPRVLVHNQNNRGIVKSLNKALELSRGDYIARMDADDISLNKRLEKQIAFLKKNLDCSIVGSFAIVHYPNGDKVLRKRPISHKNIYKNIVRICPFFHSSVMFRKNEIIKAGKYYENMDGVNSHYYEDYELWVRLLKNNLILCNIPEPLIEYSILENSILRSKSLFKRVKSQTLMRKKIINELKLPPKYYLDILFVMIVSLLSSIIRIDKLFNVISSQNKTT